MIGIVLEGSCVLIPISLDSVGDTFIDEEEEEGRVWNDVAKEEDEDEEEEEEEGRGVEEDLPRNIEVEVEVVVLGVRESLWPVSVFLSVRPLTLYVPSLLYFPTLLLLLPLKLFKVKFRLSKLFSYEFFFDDGEGDNNEDDEDDDDDSGGGDSSGAVVTVGWGEERGLVL